jgi:FlaG/FlaF family flagellin (archaellin)
MGLRERLDGLGTGPLVALALAAAAAALVLAVAVTVVLAAVIGTFVLDLESSPRTGVQAGASVDGDADGGLTVTWTSNQNAGHLLVEWTASDGNVTATDAEGRVSATGGRARLQAVGASVTLSDGAPETGTTVTVVLTAVRGEQEAVIANQEATA